MTSVSVLSMSISQIENVSLAGAILPVVVGLVLMKFVAKAMLRTVIMAVALVLGVAVYSQRSDIQACYDEARASAAAGETAVTCSFFGQDVTLAP
ncbi:MAG: hypothetical protein ACKOHN_02590 [Actinomycetota bacterium]